MILFEMLHLLLIEKIINYSNIKSSFRFMRLNKNINIISQNKIKKIIECIIVIQKLWKNRSKKQIKIFVHSYNILRFTSGCAGLHFSN
jgi:hypothetical protein